MLPPNNSVARQKRLGVNVKGRKTQDCAKPLTLHVFSSGFSEIFRMEHGVPRLTVDVGILYTKVVLASERSKVPCIKTWKTNVHKAT